ncbi:[FeFe] hydrogenase H-cluster radical SAM maturase HydG [Sphaerochaeta halotolerans]|uniref:[FeFe] hydrogenase H-cluster radical SAM maturase HydG n=1 Tax=Sphaerochaeta halotolerans TaxID=2293840 RepID=A0A372MF04_9SPIR|nr:[FeFe] hydrogenase H-cluster radical SAM maturase HydG [Sphaerochaeta halotolerans]RFU93876.1 [FeFe] hydrogenase H-cluster radical SAM maturase HydG [Sphaerochaeta halotolerans]
MSAHTPQSIRAWKEQLIHQDEIDRYLVDGKDFIDEEQINAALEKNRHSDPSRIREIIAKAFSIELMSSEDVAALLQVTDPDLRNEIAEAAKEIKKQVYDNRVVTFAPLYCGSKCVNRCAYCGFRSDNKSVIRKVLTMDEIREETRVLAGTIGHKRLIIVFGEHPETDADYIAETMNTIYEVKVPVRNGMGEIRRVNVNAAPLPIQDLKKLQKAGIGTFQVFQETYHHETYSKVHPSDTLKGNYRWRLYALHRAMDAGIDDVAIGALFGLYDWKFEVMGMVAHARDLERLYNIGPHTISFPRLTPAVGTNFDHSKHQVSDEDFTHLIAVLRLAIPYAGMIITNRETPQIMESVIDMCTQRDAESKIGIGDYADTYRKEQIAEREQFMLNDTSSLDQVIQKLAKSGHITSFCTAGYRCGRTGDKIMGLLKSGKEGCFCKLNAVLTFQEWLEDFASEETKEIGEKLIQQEIAEIRERVPKDFSQASFTKFLADYKKIQHGERDLYF